VVFQESVDMGLMEPLPRSFFNRDTLTVCSELIGKRLVRKLDGDQRLAGIITELEAYRGQEDLACHARVGKTQRNQSMWGPPGHVYMFFTYGMHWMFNLVTESEGHPAAVLIRALLPTEGIQQMQQHRKGKHFRSLTDGPGKLCQALQLDGEWDGYDVTESHAHLVVENTDIAGSRFATIGPRVGLTNVPEPWKSIPWRFRISPDDIHHIVQGGAQV
jgi:DNA-3-methyladenine glycosylase